MEDEIDPIVRREKEVEYEEVKLTDGLWKGVILGDDQNAPHFNMRKFLLDAGHKVPAHTNEVEHEQYVIEGEYKVGIEDKTYTVSAGDVLLIPAGSEHWYRNESGSEVSFLCIVPQGADQIEITE